MKKMIFFFLLVFFCSCKQEYDYTRSFVLGYSDAGRISLRSSSNNKMHFVLDFGLSSGYSLKMTGERKIRYDYLCEKHGDITYNRMATVYLHDFATRCADDFVSFEITSSAAWDADHPAGSSLGDIVRFIADTPLPYIRSGYKKKYAKGEDGEYYPIDKLVSELTPDDMMILPKSVVLYFTTPPTLSLEHTLTVRLTTDEDKVFTASLDAVF